ncbi:mandelate racemase/muconate lactonizing enzyme family protein [candidate division KSB1 bacterium]
MEKYEALKSCVRSGTIGRRDFIKCAGVAAGVIAAGNSPSINSALGTIKITNVETIVLKFPTSRPIADAIHVFSDRGGVVTKVRTDAGITGWGYTYFGMGPGSPKTLKHLIDLELAPVAIGQDPFASRKVRQDLWRATEYHGVGGITYFGITAIDMALWDICGKAVSLPVHKLLGSCHDRMPAYGMVGWYYSTEGEFEQSCASAVEEGFTAVKIKVGVGTLQEDLERIKKARHVVGTNVRLMVDANQSLSVNEAIRRGKAYEDFDIFWFEEPLPPHEKDGYALLTEALDIPIATGENEYTRYAFAELIRRRAVDIVQPDLRRTGGVTEWLEVGAIADASGIPLASHGGGSAQLNILCAIPNAIFMESGSLKGQSNRFEKLIMKDGKILAPKMPGLGSEMTSQYIERYRIG